MTFMHESGLDPQLVPKLIDIGEARVLHQCAEQCLIKVHGRILSIRRMSQITFFDLYDGTGLIQVAIKNTRSALARSLTKNTLISITGFLDVTKTDELTLFAIEEPTIDGSPTPIKNNNHSSFSENAERLFNDRTFRAGHLARLEFNSRCRDFFKKNGYIEAETAILNHVEVAGNADLFSTYSNHLKKNLYLRGTAEIQLKQMAISTLKPVYEFAKLFRNQSRGLIEFTLLETIHPWLTFHDACKLLSNLMQSTLSNLCLGNNYIRDKFMRFSDSSYTIIDCAECLWEEYNIDVLRDDSKKIRRVIGELNIPIDFKEGPDSLSVNQREKIVSILVARYSRRLGRRPIIIKGYPSSFSPFPRRLPPDNLYCALANLYFNGTRICEIVEEEHDYHRQLENFQQQSRFLYDRSASRLQNDLLIALANGAPPMCGLGLNINRLFSTLLETRDLSDVVCFPIAEGKVAK